MGAVEGQPAVADELRARRIDHVRTRRWEELLELQAHLELDACAVAAYHLGRTDARERLVGLVDAGFYDVVTHQEAHRRGGAALLKDATPPDPDLTELSTSVVDADGPAVLFETQHPYALGSP